MKNWSAMELFWHKILLKTCRGSGTDIKSASECVNWVRVVAAKSMTRETNQKAIECLEEAVESDPKYV